VSSDGPIVDGEGWTMDGDAMSSATSGAGDLRQRIIDASVELLEQEGIGGLSMREVARRAGVSHQAPYHHFADRAAILGAIAEDGFRALLARFHEAAARPAKNVFARFEHAGIAYVEFAIERPAHFRVMFRPELVNVADCPGARKAGDDAFAWLQQMVGQCFEAGLDLGESRDAVTVTAWSMVHGLACLLLDGPLAHTLPEESKARTQTIRAAMRIFRRQLESGARDQ
jgi:AcrR family transcriptional regulator